MLEHRGEDLVGLARARAAPAVTSSPSWSARSWNGPERARGRRAGRTRPRAPARRRRRPSANACRSVLFPAPDSPLTTTMPPRPSRARCSAATRNARSSSRSCNLTGRDRTDGDPMPIRAANVPPVDPASRRIRSSWGTTHADRAGAPTGRWGATPDALVGRIADRGHCSPAPRRGRPHKEKHPHEDVSSSSVRSPAPASSPRSSSRRSRRRPTPRWRRSGVPYNWVTSYVAGDKVICVHEAEELRSPHGPVRDEAQGAEAPAEGRHPPGHRAAAPPRARGCPPPVLV